MVFEFLVVELIIDESLPSDCNTKQKVLPIDLFGVLLVMGDGQLVLSATPLSETYFESDADSRFRYPRRQVADVQIALA